MESIFCEEVILPRTVTCFLPLMIRDGIGMFAFVGDGQVVFFSFKLPDGLTLEGLLRNCFG